MKKLVSLLLATLMIFSSICVSMAEAPVTSIKKQVTIDGKLYEYVKCASVNNKAYNGTNGLLLGYYQPIKKSGEISTMDTYREYDVWYVYDQGITKEWSYLSNPYFIISIARGMTYEKSKTVSATIAASFGTNIPADAKSKISSSFGINSSGTKTISEKVIFSGPDAGYSSRDFYYKQGRNDHSVKLVQEHWGNQGSGKMWTKEYKCTISVPAIKHYSVDRK